MEQCFADHHGLVTDIGPSWFKALEKEFSKPYFQQVNQERSIIIITYNICIAPYNTVL